MAISPMRHEAERQVKSASNPLYVSKPLLPDLGKLTESLAAIWSSGQVTNHGPFSLKLEERLSAMLEVPTAMLFNNATVGIMTALRLFDLPANSEVITTPMTFAATAHSISWNNLIPVFADIQANDLTLDPAAVRKAITPKTRAILAVHVYGCICDHDALRSIADEYGLKLIYDAAHAFGARWKGRSVAALGDASIFSFHATKLYNTLEGGLVTTGNPEDRRRLYLLRNFGILNEEEVVAVGLNGKMNEVQAAIGLLNLDIFEEERSRRATLRRSYRHMLDGLPGITIQEVSPDVTQSEQYFLVRIDPSRFGRSRDEVKASLDAQNIFCRKYFYPLCTDYTPYRAFPIVTVRKEPYAEVAKNEVLCLPFHSGVNTAQIEIMERVFRA